MFRQSQNQQNTNTNNTPIQPSCGESNMLSDSDESEELARSSSLSIGEGQIETELTQQKRQLKHLIRASSIQKVFHLPGQPAFDCSATCQHLTPKGKRSYQQIKYEQLVNAGDGSTNHVMEQSNKKNHSKRTGSLNTAGGSQANGRSNSHYQQTTQL